MSGILITGGSGTLGRALTRACLLDGQWTRVVCYSRNEWAQAILLEEFGAHPAYRAFLGDVRDYDRLVQACHGIDTVVAGAALKRVESTSYNPGELLKTNVIGVENTIRAAVTAGVKRVVLVSSDKAVSPTTAYGVSKAMAEVIAINANAWAHPYGTRVSAVRYGNVLGSRGSVIAIWRNQMTKKVPITLTHPQMSRFILTIGQAVEFVLAAISRMQGGEVFVPKLPSAYLTELARAVAGDLYPHSVTGLRPGGEKIAEALLNDEEPSRTLERDFSYVITPAHPTWTSGRPWHGTPIDPRLVYRSDVNDRWLTCEQLKALLDKEEVV